jgi:hypothetical protein
MMEGRSVAKSMAGTTRAAWLSTVLSILILFGLLGVPFITGTKPLLGSVGMLFVAFFMTLPSLFFWIAGDYRRQQEQIRELQNRLDDLEGRTTDDHH